MVNSRERIRKALNFEETDRVPYDLAATTWTGITITAYQNYVNFLGKQDASPRWADVIQQIVIPSEEILQEVNADVRGVFPLTSHNWDVHKQMEDRGAYYEYLDEWGFTHHFPREGYWFSLVGSPMEARGFFSGRCGRTLPLAGCPPSATICRTLRQKAMEFVNSGKAVFTKGLCAGLFEMHQRVRGMENAMLDPFMNGINSDLLIGKLADLKIEFWDALLKEIGDVVDILGEGDDYGTQQSQLIAPDQFRAYYKPHFKRVLEFMKSRNPELKILFHSCGNVRPIIPDLIEMGVDILNPVHVTATGMEPVQLKKDFGKDLVFWGGGVDTQHILPSGSPRQVKDNVRQNVEALAPGGGFVFSTIHNIQAEVPPQNITAMLEALGEYSY
jgi:uroporphyrinogen decarboxylase